MDVIAPDEAESRLDLDAVPATYRQFQAGEGVPVHRGLAVDDWRTLAVDDWERTGQRGAFVNLYGNAGVNDLHLHELAPRGRTRRLQHLHDQLVYVGSGTGAAVVGGDDTVEFEWGPGSLFYVPPNTPYRLANLSTEPARLLADTPLPQLCNTYPDTGLLFDPPGSWWDRYRDDLYARDASLRVVGEDDEGRISGIPPGTVYWDATVVADVGSFDRLDDNRLRGAGGTSVVFPFPRSGLYAHVSEFPVGRYKKAHRHHPGANVTVLSGEGFSLLWDETMDARVRVDWHAGTTFTPPARW